MRLARVQQIALLVSVYALSSLAFAADGLLANPWSAESFRPTPLLKEQKTAVHSGKTRAPSGAQSTGFVVPDDNSPSEPDASFATPTGYLPALASPPPPTPAAPLIVEPGTSAPLPLPPAPKPEAANSETKDFVPQPLDGSPKLAEPPAPVTDYVPLPAKRPAGADLAMPPPPIAEPDNETAAALPAHLDCVTGKCARKSNRSVALNDSAKEIKKTAMEATKPESAPAGEGANCKLLMAAKKTLAAAPYHNRTQSGGQCGQGVGRSIIRAGYSFPTDDRFAILYATDFLPQRGWTKLNITSPEQAPPGAVIVFKGPYSDKYLARYHGAKPPGNPAGNWVGHVTIKGDDNHHWYTDAVTSVASPVPYPYRKFYEAFVPPGPVSYTCGKQKK